MFQLFLGILVFINPSEGLARGHRSISKVFGYKVHNRLQHYVTPTTLSAVTNPTAVAGEGVAQEYSFVRDDLRTYAMKLHTRDQSPKEGQQKAETPFTKWEPARSNYLQFLVDSLEVYQTLDELTHQYPALAPFKATGLERSNELKEDIAWMVKYDSTLSVPPCGASGKAYSAFLRSLAAESLPKFMCHYYNHYFAHTAGGRMIGKGMADKLLEGTVLKFYQWNGDVKVRTCGTSGRWRHGVTGEGASQANSAKDCVCLLVELVLRLIMDAHDGCRFFVTAC